MILQWKNIYRIGPRIFFTYSLIYAHTHPIHTFSFSIQTKPIHWHISNIFSGVETSSGPAVSIPLMGK